MKKIDTKIGKLIRSILAILLALLFIAIETPNMGHFVIHPAISPATVFESSFHDRLMVCFWPVIPLICIFVGMFREPLLEYIGWGLLIILFVGGLH
jgi:hypothetical protein